MYRFNAIPQDSNVIFHRTRTNISKIYMEPQKSPHNKKEEKVGGFMLPNIKLYDKAIAIKQSGIGIKTDIDQWN